MKSSSMLVTAAGSNCCWSSRWKKAQEKMPNIPPPSGLYRSDNYSRGGQSHGGDYNRDTSSSGSARGISAFQNQKSRNYDSYSNYQHKRSYGDYNQDQDSGYHKKSKRDDYESNHLPMPVVNSNRFSLDLSPPSFQTNLPSSISIEALNAFLIRVRLQEINEQSVSYSSMDTHKRSKLYDEIQQLIKAARFINPLFSYENHFSSSLKQFIAESEGAMFSDQDETSARLVSKKIYVPVDKYPDYNFIGLIIGPGGTTQQNLEKESGAKIAVRGKGSVKPGKVVSKPLMGDEEDLHVLITAEDEDSVEKAAEMVQRLLIPLEEGSNELKKEQLKILAIQRGFINAEGMEGEEMGDSAFLSKLQSYGLNQHMPDQPPIPGVTSIVEIPGITDKVFGESALDKLQRDLSGETAEEQPESIEAPKIEAPSTVDPFADSYAQTYWLYHDQYKQYFTQQQETYQRFLDLYRGYSGVIPRNDQSAYFRSVLWALENQIPQVPGQVPHKSN